jgi:hypothetical protein
LSQGLLVCGFAGIEASNRIRRRKSLAESDELSAGYARGDVMTTPEM